MPLNKSLVGPTNREAAEAAFHKAYADADQKPVTDIRWCESPMSGVHLAEELGDSEPTAGWCFETYDPDTFCTTDLFDNINQVAKHCGWWKPYDNMLIAVDKPIRVSQDSEERLHHRSHMALEYRDGWGLFRLHGVAVSAWVILKPESLTQDEIDLQTDPEVQQAMQGQFDWYKSTGGSNE